MPNNSFDENSQSTRNGNSSLLVIERSKDQSINPFFIPPSSAVICQPKRVNCKQVEFGGQFDYQIIEIASNGVRIAGDVYLQIGKSVSVTTKSGGNSDDYVISIPSEATVIYEGPWTRNIDSFIPFEKDFIIELPFDSKINIRYSTRSKGS